MANDSGQSGRIGQRQENVNHGLPFVTNDTYPEAPWDGMLVYNEDVSQFQIYSLRELGWLDPYLGAAGNQTYVGPDEPSDQGVRVGDLWIKTPGNALHRFDGSEWVSYIDPRVGNKTTPGPTPPPSPILGDTWVKTDENNKVFVWSGQGWLQVTATIPPGTITGLEVQDFAFTVKKLQTNTHQLY